MYFTQYVAEDDLNFWSSCFYLQSAGITGLPLTRVPLIECQGLGEVSISLSVKELKGRKNSWVQQE